MNQLIEGDFANIAYHKDNEKSEPKPRVIIPSSLPKDYMNALDVTHLAEDEQLLVKQQYSDYLAYVNLLNKNKFSFEEWVNHTYVDSTPKLEIKWRRFKMGGVELLEE